MRGKNKELSEKNKTIIKLLFLGIVAYSIIYSMVFANGVSYFGDDIAYSWFAHYVTHGTFVQNAGDILSVRILQIYPIGLFYWVFGVSNLSSAAWEIIAFVGTVIVVFYIGKELYNEYAGLLASLLFAFFPVVVIYSMTMSDNPPMMFLVSLAMLGLIYGERRKSRKWYFVCGVSLLASCLVMPEGLMAIGIVVLYLLIKFIVQRFKIDKNVLYIIYGAILVSIVVMAFGYLTTKNPLITFGTVLNFYQTSSGFVPANANLPFYINVMFPYKLSGVISSNILGLNLSPISIWKQIYIVNYNTVGFYFYFAFLAIMYLVCKKEKKSYFLLFWFAVGLLIMEFDPFHISLSPFSYQLQHRLDRYLTLIAPPATILISIAGVKLVQEAKKYKKYVYGLLVFAALLFMIITAVQVNLIQSNIMLYQRYNQIQIAKYLDTVPNTTMIYYSSGQAVPIYMDFNNVSRLIVYDEIQNCTDIKAGSYIILPIYYHIYTLNYTPSAKNTCTYWQPIATDNLSNVPSYAQQAGEVDQEQLYYVPKLGNNTR